MIVKISDVSHEGLAEVMEFLASDANVDETTDNGGNPQEIVVIRLMDAKLKSSHRGDDEFEDWRVPKYDLTLEVRDNLKHGTFNGRPDPKYLVEVYERVRTHTARQ